MQRPAVSHGQLHQQMMEVNSESDELGELDEDDFGEGLFENSQIHLEDAEENASNEEDEYPDQDTGSDNNHMSNQ